MPDLRDTMDIFRRVCEQVTDVAERFGLGVVVSDDHLIVYATSPHMGGCSSNYIPPNAQHYLKVRVYNSGSSRVSWWPYPVISNTGTIKLSSLGSIYDDDQLYGEYRSLADLDMDKFPDEFVRVTEQVVNRINELERRLDAKDQLAAILDIRSSSENLRFAIDGTNPRLEETLHPCAGPEYT